MTKVRFVLDTNLLLSAALFKNSLARNDFLELVEMVDITRTIVDCRDPRDDKFLELATSGHAQFILTNDKDLLVLNPYENISIV